tara:strand:- start:1976 stop:2923 length:948 start_codon:yes stop_codon:yes gene_type:complete
MILKKPKFWDNVKPTFLAYLLLIFTVPIIVNNLFIDRSRNRKINKEKNIISICVGNIYIGGTGKTPLSIKISQILSKFNFKTAIVKKFYADQVDEQKLITNSSKLYCHVNRKEAFEQSIRDECDIAIFDDGLQDKTMIYDLKFACFNSLKWIGNGFLIPAGPLREKLKSISKFDAIFLNGNEENTTELKTLINKYNKNIKIFETYYKSLNIHEFNHNDNYLIFSGIGNPDSFKKTLIKNNLKIIKEITFPDHHQYTKKNINDIKLKAKKLNAKILTTEKDFMKLDNDCSQDVNYLAIDLVIKNEDKLIDFIRFKK